MIQQEKVNPVFRSYHYVFLNPIKCPFEIKPIISAFFMLYIFFELFFMV